MPLSADERDRHGDPAVAGPDHRNDPQPAGSPRVTSRQNSASWYPATTPRLPGYTSCRPAARPRPAAARAGASRPQTARSTARRRSGSRSSRAAAARPVEHVQFPQQLHLLARCSRRSSAAHPACPSSGHRRPSRRSCPAGPAGPSGAAGRPGCGPAPATLAGATGQGQLDRQRRHALACGSARAGIQQRIQRLLPGRRPQLRAPRLGRPRRVRAPAADRTSATTCLQLNPTGQLHSPSSNSAGRPSASEKNAAAW